MMNQEVRLHMAVMDGFAKIGENEITVFIND